MSDEFLSFVTTQVHQGQRQLADTIRTLLYHTAPQLFELLDPNNDDIFLEPLLFAHFNATERHVPLAQLLYGYIVDDAKPESVAVLTDEGGILCVPNLGYFVTDAPETYLRLHMRPDAGPHLTLDDGTTVAYDFEPCIKLDGTAIEICKYLHPLLESYFPDRRRESANPAGGVTMPEHALSLARGFEIVGECHPEYLKNLVKVTRRMLLYEAPYPFSFATMRAHGVAFLNTTKALDEVFFVEDIVHQCGHIMFNAMTSDKDEYLAVDPDAPLSRFAPTDGENSVYAAFHGLFTQANINQCLSICYEKRIFSGRREHELLGRISDDMKRFASALSHLSSRELYTDQGWFLYSAFKKIFLNLYEERGELINAFDTSNQPYIFDYETFRTTNPR